MPFRFAFVSLLRLHRLVAMAALLGLAAITAVDVCGRVLFNAPLGFAYELVGILLGVAVYAGLVSTNWHRDHIQIDILAPRLARFPRFERFREAVVWLLEFVFFTLLAIYIFRQMSSLMRWHETFLFLRIEKWIPLAAFGCFASLAVFAVVAAVLPGLKPREEDGA